MWLCFRLEIGRVGFIVTYGWKEGSIGILGLCLVCTCFKGLWNESRRNGTGAWIFSKVAVGDSFVACCKPDGRPLEDDISNFMLRTCSYCCGFCFGVFET